MSGTDAGFGIEVASGTEAGAAEEPPENGRILEIRLAQSSPSAGAVLTRTGGAGPVTILPTAMESAESGAVEDESGAVEEKPEADFATGSAPAAVPTFIDPKVG